MLYPAFLRRTAWVQLPGAIPSIVMTPASSLRKWTRLSSSFRVVQHTIKGDHTREYIAATKNGDEDTPRLSVKQYIPLNNPNPQPGDVSIIAAHANGFPKELYEPLWETLVDRMADQDLRIRSIWIADAWHQGESGIINENILGNDPNWFDHSRDLLNLINQKQDEIPHPLVGIGHSMGGTQLAHLSLIHPRLLHSLVLIDPVIQSTNPGIAPAIPSTSRRDLWPSKNSAIESFKRSKFYQAWDPRALDLWIKHGLRPTPTELHPSPETTSTEEPVTLATSKHQELFSYLRPMYRPVPGNPYADKGPLTTQGQDPDYPFYRPEPLQVFHRLPELRPSVLYVFGKDSYFATPELREAKMAATGTGLGGSGGVAAGRVQDAVLDCGHMIPMEKVEECGERVAGFLSKELHRWKKERSAFEEYQRGKSRYEQMAIDERWKAEVVPAGYEANKPRI